MPEGAWLGLHVCYGSLQHRAGESPDSAHYTPIRDLGTGVRMLNRGVVACGRRVDFVHMPVQLADQRDGHYAPLDDLDVGDARVYLGLIDTSDGLDGALARIEPSPEQLHQQARDGGVSRQRLFHVGLAERHLDLA